MFSENKKTILSGVMGAVIVGMVFGFGNFMQPATAGVSGPECDSGNGFSIFYDKILFTTTKSYVKDGPPSIVPGMPYDVIVPAGLGFVMDPRAQVLSELSNQGYARPNGNPPAIWAIQILDVEVTTVCYSPGVQPT